jgi:hypothetical protein
MPFEKPPMIRKSALPKRADDIRLLITTGGELTQL